jgi:transcriptional regulator with GAF, ATPase, and Fis domain
LFQEDEVQNAALHKNTSDAADQCQIQSVQVQEEHGFHGIIGQSRKMCEVFDLVQKVADCDSTILLNGETGTGKGIVARAIHQRSKR